MMADYYSANSAPIYPTAKLVDDHTGMYTGSGGIQYLYFYRSSAPLDEVVKYYDGKFGGAEKIYYDEHRKSTVYAYKTIKTARLAHTYCQVISFGEKGMPDVSVAIYSVDDPNGLNTEIYVVTDWLD